MNKDKVFKLIEYAKKNDFYIDIERDFYIPLLEALGDDQEEILSFLDALCIENLELVSGIFEYIYKKFMTEEMWEALERLEDKL